MTHPPRVPFILSPACTAAELRAAAQAAEAMNNPRLAALLEQRAHYWETIDLASEPLILPWETSTASPLGEEPAR